jgi:cytochrome c peroxidase
MDIKRKSQRKTWIAASVAALPAVLVWAGDAAALTPLELLGKHVFFDKISRPEDAQACASCHAPLRGWTLPDSKINNTTVSAPGARAKRSGSLKPPANAYAFFIPPFRNNGNPFLAPFEGGNFWDGRAEGFGKIPGAIPVDGTTASKTVTLADIPASKQGDYAQYLGPTADQALNPFPNGVEQNIRIKRVCKNVRDASYSEQYYKAYGEYINCKGVETDPTSPVSISFRRIALALAAYQGSKEVSPFNSKRDWALQTDTDKKFPLDGFSAKENLGHDLFYGTNRSGDNNGGPNGAPKNANCAVCHSGLPGQAGPTIGFPFGNGTDAEGENLRQLYADSFYHNIALPYNREIKQTVLDATTGKVVDNGVTVAFQEKKGLSQHVTSLGAADGGLFKTPTLRNVDKGATWGFVKAYMHNGYFKNLEDVVHFYNTRSILKKCEDLGITNATAAEAKKYNCWPVPEFDLANSAAPFLLGNLGLTDSEEAALVAYLKTLSDSTTAKAP